MKIFLKVEKLLVFELYYYQLKMKIFWRWRNFWYLNYIVINWRWRYFWRWRNFWYLNYIIINWRWRFFWRWRWGIVMKVKSEGEEYCCWFLEVMLFGILLWRWLMWLVFPILNIFPAYGTWYFSPDILPDVVDFQIFVFHPYFFILWLMIVIRRRCRRRCRSRCKLFHKFFIPDLFWIFQFFFQNHVSCWIDSRSPGGHFSFWECPVSD